MNTRTFTYYSVERNWRIIFASSSNIYPSPSANVSYYGPASTQVDRTDAAFEIKKNAHKQRWGVGAKFYGRYCRIPGPVIYMCRCTLENEVYSNSC